MSHFTVLVLLKPESENIEGEVSKVLAPFNENTEVPEYKSFLSEEDVTRMRNFYQSEGKLSKEDTNLESLLPFMDEWHGERGGIEEGHLFYWSTYNPMSKWDWYTVGGRWSDAVPDNKARVCELPEDFIPYAVASEQGWNEKGKMGWFGMGALRCH